MISARERIIRPISSRVSLAEAYSVGALFLTVLVSRVIFITHYLYHWDSVNFAYSLVEFNLEKNQPQPPGYIVYVWLSRLVNGLIHNPDLSMVLLSVLASSLAVAVFYFLGKTLFDARTGWIAAAFLAVSPLFWFYGEVALPHTLDALFVIAAAWLLYRVMRGEQRYLIPAVVVLAIAGGIRQQTLLFLGPLALFSVRRVGWKRLALAALVGGVVCLAWFIPLISQSGGLSSYIHTVSAFGGSYEKFTSITEGAGLQGIRHNLGKLIPYTLYGLFMACIPFLLLVSRRVRDLLAQTGWEKWLFLGLWAAPAMVFYTFIHMGQQGLVFVFLPALILISASALGYWAENSPRRFAFSLAAIIAVSAGFFLLMPEYPLGKSSQRLLTRDTLANSDVYYRNRLELIQNRFEGSSTAILATNWHHVDYYLPGYHLLRFAVDITGTIDDMQRATVTSDDLQGTPEQLGLKLDASHQAYLIVFDPALDPFNRTAAAPQSIALPDDHTLYYYELNANDVIAIHKTSFEVIRK